MSQSKYAETAASRPRVYNRNDNFEDAMNLDHYGTQIMKGSQDLRKVVAAAKQRLARNHKAKDNSTSKIDFSKKPNFLIQQKKTQLRAQSR